MLGGDDPITTLAHGIVLVLIRLPNAGFASPPGYLDPGTGSLMIQAVIAAILTVPFIFRTRTRAIFRRLRHRGPAEGPPDDPRRSD